ncbi:S41 family peptidase [uncultured Alistipes sp.]|jgi:hypothetical protein|uniref:S41 family peptidase n=1 Tax=uncultured Alistipes sp. TaxID=538949 RepID=UPI002601513A|nr:S41 family peptidase [uncultured Alistipes sp.]
MRKICLLLAVLLFWGSHYAQTPLRNDWDTDLDYLAEELPKRHYNFFSVKSKADFLAELEHIKKNKDDLSDYEIAIKVQQLIAGFGDSHSSLNYSLLVDKAMILPIDSYWFSDGLYILKTTPENSEILGDRIVSVNGTPLSVVVDSLATLVTMDNPAILKMSVPKLLPYIQTLEAFGFAESSEVELGLQDIDGNDKTYRLKPALMTRANQRSVRPDSLALCYINGNRLFTDTYLPEEDIYYLQYNECWSKELEMKWGGDKQKAEKLPSFKQFSDRVFRNLEADPVDKILFDMRFNDGGGSAQGTEFVERLAKYLDRHPKTKVYVVLGRKTFSSAILNAMDFKRLTNAIFVGEETAGKPNHFGEVLSFPLPASGLKVRYSSKYFKRSSENANTIAPDITQQVSFREYISGIDPVYEWIAKQ